MGHRWPALLASSARARGIRALLDAKFDVFRGRIKNDFAVGAESTWPNARPNP